MIDNKTFSSLAQRAFHSRALLGSLGETSQPLSMVQTSGNVVSTDCVIMLSPAENKLGVGWRALLKNQSFASSPTTTTTRIERDRFRAAFDELEEARADTSKFLGVVSELRTEKSIPEASRLAVRLETLLTDYQADYGLSLSVESLRTLVRFLFNNPHLKSPIITATPNGNLFGEWKSEGRYLGVQFLTNRHGRYVAVRPNPLYPHHRIRASGVVTTDQLLSEIASHNINEWAGRAA